LESYAGEIKAGESYAYTGINSAKNLSGRIYASQKDGLIERTAGSHSPE